MLGAEIDDTDDERFQHMWPYREDSQWAAYGMGNPLAADLDVARGIENRVQYVPVNRRKDTIALVARSEP